MGGGREVVMREAKRKEASREMPHTLQHLIAELDRPRNHQRRMRLLLRTHLCCCPRTRTKFSSLFQLRSSHGGNERHVLCTDTSVLQIQTWGPYEIALRF